MSRLTMQEVIEHCERTVNACNRKTILNNIDTKRYWEHKQTAEWLKELQHYKDLEEAGRLIRKMQGGWILQLDESDVEFIECSLCGSTFYDSDNDTIDDPYNYCPYCGARMDKGVITLERAVNRIKNASKEELEAYLAELKGTEE